jgi:alkylresorcinol/alkylpyrone synthase
MNSQPNSSARLPVTIASTATALPEHAITQNDVKRYLQRVFSLDEMRLEGMMAVVSNSQVDCRYCIHPIDEIIEPRSITETSLQYQEHSIRLGRRVAEQALERAGLNAQEIDLIVTVSCTGFMIPSLDAHLINEMGFRSDVKRLPVTELGCAAGAAMLARAGDFLRGVSEGSALVVAVELPSLTFQRGNVTQANLISSILFGDGAAAAVVTTRPAAGPKIVASRSHLFPRSIEAMGFDLKDSGFNIVLSRDVPQMIRDAIRGLVDCFLSKHGLCRKQVPAFVLHPGGQKLLYFVEEELELDRSATQPSWDVLRDCGNLSSASVLFVLHEWLERRRVGPGQFGLLAAFGPGFSCEMSLLEWS